MIIINGKRDRSGGKLGEGKKGGVSLIIRRQESGGRLSQEEERWRVKLVER